MAEGSSSGTLSSSIKELLSEVRDQNRQIITIQEEVRAKPANVSSQVIKLKTEQEYTWKRTGNKIKFCFNSEKEIYTLKGQSVPV